MKNETQKIKHPSIIVQTIGQEILTIQTPAGLPGSNGAASMYYVPEVRPLETTRKSDVLLELDDVAWSL